ncbi:MAG: hypothetical protein ACI30X_07050 [Muribaculaceae bacterium]
MDFHKYLKYPLVLLDNLVVRDSNGFDIMYFNDEIFDTYSAKEVVAMLNGEIEPYKYPISGMQFNGVEYLPKTQEIMDEWDELLVDLRGADAFDEYENGDDIQDAFGEHVANILHVFLGDKILKLPK